MNLTHVDLNARQLHLSSKALMLFTADKETAAQGDGGGGGGWRKKALVRNTKWTFSSAFQMSCLA